MKLGTIVRNVGTEDSYVIQGIEEVASNKLRYRYKLFHCIGEFSQDKKTFKEWEITCDDEC